MKRIIFISGFLFMLLSCTNQTKETTAVKNTLLHEKKMEWWNDARFGMFIHWGLYSIPAGEWKGEEIPGESSWIMANAKIPVNEYEKLATQFNPVKFDAEKWVKLAKFAGMKYIVITAKSQDGFAMFPSKISKFNILDATPFNRDFLKELADACKKYDIRLGFYYSQAQDWHEPGGAYPGNDQGKTFWDPELKPEPFTNYIDGKAVPQIKEILENYDLDILWWDTPTGMTEEAAKKLQNVVDEYPDLITNNRLYKSIPGDFSVQEQSVPPTQQDHDWEVCKTMNTNWGYNKYDNNWKTSESLIRTLVNIASKGGNFLLNVGPTAEGLIPEQSAECLKEIGIWMQKNGESIYGTSASPFFKLPWGRCTMKKTDSGNLLYFHAFDWPKDGILRIPGLDTRIKDVYLLTNPKQKFAYKFDDGDFLIHAPTVIFDPVNTVVVVKTAKKIDITSNMPILKEGKVLLPADFADIYNPGYGNHAVLSGSGTESVIQNWTDYRTRLEWMFKVSEPGKYKIEALINAAQSCKLEVKLGENKLISEIVATNGKFEILNLGEIEISESGEKIISLSPVPDNWRNVEIMYVELLKQ